MRHQWTVRSRGFSSIELITAVMITMIVTAIAVAGYRLYQRDLPVKYAADRLVRAMAAARSYAVANNSYYTVQLDQRYQNYWIDETDEFGAVVVPKVTAPEPLGEQTRFAAFTLGAIPVTTATVPMVPIKFSPDGSCDDARITLRMGSAPAAVYYDVRVYGPTGVSKITANAAAPANELLAAAPRRATAPPAPARKTGRTGMPARQAVSR